ncbi:hypothetical protein E2C01_093028 [Portunus trituberculatus]|uniref:Uncharacterized protein n=1 Tax=Portunus trituberculatus TaxID=210409 RepID=A0A5B7JNR6_PORTR|nr:hypothetical protein [Portunus trituberculatus]
MRLYVHGLLPRYKFPHFPRLLNSGLDLHSVCVYRLVYEVVLCAPPRPCPFTPHISHPHSTTHLLHPSPSTSRHAFPTASRQNGTLSTISPLLAVSPRRWGAELTTGNQSKKANRPKKRPLITPQTRGGVRGIFGTSPRRDG